MFVVSNGSNALYYNINGFATQQKFVSLRGWCHKIAGIKQDAFFCSMKSYCWLVVFSSEQYAYISSVAMIISLLHIRAMFIPGLPGGCL